MVGKILKNPITILLSVIGGVCFGFFYKTLAIKLGIIGDLYLNFFQMTVIPILITSIVSSLAQLMRDKDARSQITKIIAVFLLMLVLVSILGTLAGVFGKPGKNLGDSTTAVLDKIIKSTAQSSNDEMTLKAVSGSDNVKKVSVFDFVLRLIPSNIFSSLSGGRILEIVFFSIIFGIAIGFIKEESSKGLVQGTLAFKESFQKLIAWTMFGLPFGLFFLIGKQIAQVGVEILLAMVKFILVFHIVGLVVFFACTIIIWIRSGIKNPFRVLKILMDSIIISIATRNSFAALPASVSALTEMNFKSTTVNLVFPLGLTVLRFGNIIYFAVASCFVAQIYGTSLGLTSLLLVTFGSLLAGTATAGASGLLTLPMLSFILDPLGLPIESILVVFMAIDSLVDPMRTFLIVYTNIAVTALIAERQTEEQAAAEKASEQAGLDFLNPVNLHKAPILQASKSVPLSQVASPSENDKKTKRDNVVVHTYARHEPHTRSGLRIKIRDALILVNTLLIVATAAIIITISSRSTQDSVYSVSNNLVTEILNSVVTKVQSYYRPAEQSVHDIGFHYWHNDLSDFRHNEDKAIRYFLETLRTHPEFVMVYFADTDGNLLMARRMPDGSLTQRYIERTENSVKTSYVHENKQYNSSFPNTVESLEKGYDPRTRPWYIKAIEKRTLVWTDVYIFATDNMPGFSCALPIFQDDGSVEGVVCIDIGIKDLSLYLGSLSATENSRLFIYDHNNQIIAKPITQDQILNELFNITEEKGKSVYTLKKVDSSGDQVISQAYTQGLDHINEKGTYSFKLDTHAYFAKITSIELERGMSFRIAMVIPDEDIMGVVYQNNRIVLIFSLIVVIVAIIISIFISAVISRPLDILSSEMNGIKQLLITDGVDIKSNIVEIDDMVTSFQGMKKGLTNFKKYVPADLVNLLIKNNQDANIGGEKRKVTLFFSDIENFTSISESTIPEELLNMLYEYFSLFENAINQNNGTLDKYIGDSIMAFWGAPIPMDEKTHAQLACRSALICQTLGLNLSNSWVREGKARFRTRMGIHTGEVIVGNMGSDERINYTVLGDNVNLASRLEGLNKFYGTEIIISDATQGLVKEDFELRLLDKIVVKGKTKPIYIFELLAEKNKLDKNLLKVYRRYENGLVAYFKGEWDEALKHFDAVLQATPDEPTMIMRKRVEKNKLNPPENWNGVYVFDSK